MKDIESVLIAACGVALILGMVVSTQLYLHHKNELIAKADSCWKAQIINGDGGTSSTALAICGLIAK